MNQSSRASSANAVCFGSVGMMRWFLTSSAALLSLAVAVETPSEKGPKRAAAAAGQELEVTSDTLNMDFGGRSAVFEGNVRVSDAKMVLSAEKMNVVLTEDEELQSIEAIGNVVIEELGTEHSATAGRAFYDVLAGTVTMLEDPWLFDGESSKTRAKKIIYYRDTEKFYLEDPVIKWRTRGRGEGGLPSLFRPGGKKGEQRQDDGIDESAGKG